MLPAELSELVIEKVVVNKWQGVPLHNIPYEDYKNIQALNLYGHFGIDPRFIERAIVTDDRHFVEWIRKYRPDAFTIDLIVHAASCGRVDLTEWIWENLGEVAEHANTALAFGAKYGHTQLVEWAFPKATDYVPAIQSAAGNGHAHILEWFAERISKDELIKSDALTISASNGHLYATKWLHEQFPEMCTHGVFDWAAGNGHHKVVEWLHWHCQHQPCTMVAILVSTRRGNLKMVKWLYENRPELANSLDIVQQVAEAFEQKEISEWVTNFWVMDVE